MESTSGAVGQGTLSRGFLGLAALLGNHHSVVARLVRLLTVTWGSLRVTREDPARVLLTDARAPVGSTIFASSVRGWTQASDSGCSGNNQVGEQSPGTLTDAFAVVTRYREVPSHP